MEQLTPDASPRETVVVRELSTPRSAGIAGVAFALLFGLFIALMAVSFTEKVTSQSDPVVINKDTAQFALSIVPFAGLAFLWFIGVVRDLMGRLEDQFFATVFFGSGLLFIAMLFVAAAIAGGLLSGTTDGSIVVSQDSQVFARQVMFHIIRIYAIRMAGVFMLSLGTIWFRTGLMPRWLTLLTFVLAIILLLTSLQTPLTSFVLPGWVLLISILILVRARKQRLGRPETEEQPA